MSAESSRSVEAPTSLPEELSEAGELEELEAVLEAYRNQEKLVQGNVDAIHERLFMFRKGRVAIQALLRKMESENVSKIKLSDGRTLSQKRLSHDFNLLGGRIKEIEQFLDSAGVYHTGLDSEEEQVEPDAGRGEHEKTLAVEEQGALPTEDRETNAPPIEERASTGGVKQAEKRELIPGGIETSEVISFTHAEIAQGVRETLSQRGLDLNNLTVEGSGDTLVLRASGTVPLAGKISLEATVVNSEGGIAVTGLNVGAGILVRGMVESRIRGFLPLFSHVLREHISRLSGGVVGRMWIEDGKLKAVVAKRMVARPAAAATGVVAGEAERRTTTTSPAGPEIPAGEAPADALRSEISAADAVATVAVATGAAAGLVASAAPEASEVGAPDASVREIPPSPETEAPPAGEAGVESQRRAAREYLEASRRRLGALGGDAERLARTAGERYRKIPLKYKLAFSALLVGGVSGAALVGGATLSAAMAAAFFGSLAQRGLGGLATYVAFEGVLGKLAERRRAAGKKERWYHRHKKITAGVSAALLATVPKMILENIVDAVSGGDLPEGWERERLVRARGTLGNLESMQEHAAPGPLFEGHVPPEPPVGVFQVKGGDTVWKLLAEGLRDRDAFEGLGRAGQKTYVIDVLKHKLSSLSPEKLQELGFSSDSIGAIKAGETIDLSPVLNDSDLIGEARAAAAKFTEEQIKNIESYRAPAELAALEVASAETPSLDTATRAAADRVIAGSLQSPAARVEEIQGALRGDLELLSQESGVRLEDYANRPLGDFHHDALERLIEDRGLSADSIAGSAGEAVAGVDESLAVSETPSVPKPEHLTSAPEAPETLVERVGVEYKNAIADAYGRDAESGISYQTQNMSARRFLREESLIPGDQKLKVRLAELMRETNIRPKDGWWRPDESVRSVLTRMITAKISKQ